MLGSEPSMVASSNPKLRVMHSLVYRRKTTMIFESEKTAPVDAEEYWAEIPTAGCGMQSVVVRCEARVRAASKSKSSEEGSRSSVAHSGFCESHQFKLGHRSGDHRASRVVIHFLRMAVQGS